MKTAFAKLLQVYQIDHQTIADCWQNIVTHYQQPHRHYHTLHHIQALLEQFDGIKDQLKQPESVLLAIFYHDVIYQTQGKPAMSNERQRAAYFLDMDLRILGQTDLVYQAYCQQIRLEYQHVAKVLYNFSRKKALKRFLDRKRLYFTERFSTQYEQQARQNIKSEIKTLTLF